MGNSIVCMLILAGFLGREMCASASCFSGTRAVNWTLYGMVRELTWNEASRFCKERGGYLPVTNTHITAAFFQGVAQLWESIEPKIWLGLHNSVSGEIHNVWDRDCCLLPPSVQYWATDFGEPNNLDSQRCSRMSVQTPSGGWRTTFCTMSKLVVCETDRGNCTYVTLNDTTVTTLPDVSKANVNDVSTCWSLCLELRHNGEECVAAVLEETALCKLYVGQRLLDESEIATSPSTGSVIMLRRCFNAETSMEKFPEFTYNDGSSFPNPWSVACPDVYNPGVDPPDLLPPCVEPGLVTMTTCLPTTAETAAPETTITTSSSTASSPSTQSVSPATDDMMTTPLSSPNSVNSVESSSPETTVGTVAEDGTTSQPTTTETAAPDTTTTPTASTTSSSSTQPTPPVADDTMTTSPPPQPSSTNSLNSAESSSPETTVGTVTKDGAAASPKSALCPCSCRYTPGSKHQYTVNLTARAKNPVNLTVIAKNQTSKYRRSKTSVWTGQTSHAILGTPWVVACVCVFFCIVLCDLNPRKWRPYLRRGTRKNKVAPN